MKKRFSINGGKWLREPKQEQWLIEEIYRAAKLSKFWAAAARVRRFHSHPAIRQGSIEFHLIHLFSRPS
jgi:hypothetical protein